MCDRHSGCNHPRSARWRSKVRCWEHYLLIISHVSSHMLSFNFTRVPKDKIGFSQSTNTSQGEARGDKVSSYLSLLFIFNQLISILIQSNNKHRTKIDKWRKSSTIQVFTILLKKFSWIWMLKICGQINQSMQCSGWGNLYAFQKQVKKNGLNLFDQWRVLTMKMLLSFLLVYRTYSRNLFCMPSRCHLL